MSSVFRNKLGAYLLDDIDDVEESTDEEVEEANDPEMIQEKLRDVYMYEREIQLLSDAIDSVEDAGDVAEGTADVLEAKQDELEESGDSGEELEEDHVATESLIATSIATITNLLGDKNVNMSPSKLLTEVSSLAKDRSTRDSVAWYASSTVSRMEKLGFHESFNRNYYGTRYKDRLKAHLEGIKSTAYSIMDFLINIWNKLIGLVKRGQFAIIKFFKNVKTRAEQLKKDIDKKDFTSDPAETEHGDLKKLTEAVNGAEHMDAFDAISAELLKAELVGSIQNIANKKGLAKAMDANKANMPKVLESAIEAIKESLTTDNLEEATKEIQKNLADKLDDPKKIGDDIFKVYESAGSSGGADGFCITSQGAKDSKGIDITAIDLKDEELLILSQWSNKIIKGIYLRIGDKKNKGKAAHVKFDSTDVYSSGGLSVKGSAKNKDAAAAFRVAVADKIDDITDLLQDVISGEPKLNETCKKVISSMNVLLDALNKARSKNKLDKGGDDGGYDKEINNYLKLISRVIKHVNTNICYNKLYLYQDTILFASRVIKAGLVKKD